MKELLLNGTPDPTNQNQAQLIFYVPNTELAARSGKFVLSDKADTCDYTWGEAGGRGALIITNSTANSVKLTYSLHPSTLPSSGIPVVTGEPFSWTIAMWLYVGPEDFTANITNSNPNGNGQYIGTFNFLNRTAQDSGTRVDKRQMRLWIGRGSTTTLALVLGRYVNDGSWQTIKVNKSSNLTLSKGWHLVWIRPQSTRSTLVWGIDDQAFSNAASFFSATDDWTDDFYLGSDFCISSGNKTNNLPRGPLRVYRHIISTADLATLYEDDIW